MSPLLLLPGVDAAAGLAKKKKSPLNDVHPAGSPACRDPGGHTWSAINHSMSEWWYRTGVWCNYCCCSCCSCCCSFLLLLAGLQIEAYLENEPLDSASLWEHAGKGHMETTHMWEEKTYGLFIYLNNSDMNPIYLHGACLYLCVWCMLFIR